MPYPYWRYTCEGTEFWSTEPICSTCGETGSFDGWDLTMHEAMGRYQYIYKLLPIGPHRGMTDRLFKDLRRDCPACGGKGLFTLSEQAWAACGTCEGTGGFWTVAPWQVEEIRRQIIAAFPQAAAPPGLRFLSGVLVQDMTTNRIIDASREEIPAVPSGHGTISRERIERAFAQACAELGTRWCLKGRRRTRRVTIRSHLARSAATGARGCWQIVTPQGSGSRRRVFPLPIVERAAGILGVPVSKLVSREFV